MNKINCPKCNHEFPLNRLVEETYAICPKCGEKIETEEDVEFTAKQENRIDDVYNAVYELCRVILEDEELKWDMSLLGPLADSVIGIFIDRGHTVHFPSIVYDEDETYIEEYVRPVQEEK